MSKVFDDMIWSDRDPLLDFKDASMPGLSPLSQISVFLFLFALIFGQAFQVAAVEGEPSIVPTSDASKDHGLAALSLAEVNGDVDRLYESLHAARMLAEAGAGYEAARVLAAIALRGENTDVGREAMHVLESWGLTIDGVRNGTANEINGIIASRTQSHRGSGARLAHVGNLIELKQYAAAADAIQQADVALNSHQIEENWGEILERYRVPRELVRSDLKGAREKLVDELQQAHERKNLRRHARLLWAVDPEAAELAHMLLERLEPQRDRGDDRERDEHEELHYLRWVERRDDDRRQDQPSIDELAPRAIAKALRLAPQHAAAARVLTAVVIEAAPKSLAADTARTLASKLTSVVRKNVGRDLARHDDPGAELFGSQQVREYRLELSPSAIKDLHDTPKEYVRATFCEGDDTYPNVGVRLKGGYGSFRMIDGKAKAAFTVKFNQFVKGQRFHGLRRIILNNGVQDPSYLNEFISYELFRQAGVPAPRIGFASVTVNGESYGLYVQVEAVTQDYLSRWYEKSDGNLYEGPGDVMHWNELDLDSNQKAEDRSDLRRLAEAVERADDDDPWSTLADFIDLDEFTRFLALEQLLGHWDGYTQTNNYRLYHNPFTEKFEFFPHGADQIGEEPGGNIFMHQGGILGRALLQSKTGKKKYCQTMRQLLDQVWDEEALRGRIAEAYTLIRPHVVGGQGKGHGPEEFEERVSHLLEFVSLRRSVVEYQLRQSELGPSWRRSRRHSGVPSFLRRSHHDW